MKYWEINEKNANDCVPVCSRWSSVGQHACRDDAPSKSDLSLTVRKRDPAHEHLSQVVIFSVLALTERHCSVSPLVLSNRNRNPVFG